MKSWMMRRSVSLLLLCAAVGGSPAWAERLKDFPLKGLPWFNRGDPKIQAVLFVRRSGLSLGAGGVGVASWRLGPSARGEAPALGDFIEQAFLRRGRAGRIRHVDSSPPRGRWDAPLGKISIEERIAAALIQARARELEVIVLARTDTLFRTASHGLLLKATVWLVDVADGSVLWHGRKSASWLRHFPLEDCLLLLAESFVDEWPEADVQEPAPAPDDSESEPAEPARGLRLAGTSK